MRNCIKIGGMAKTIEDMDFLVNILQEPFRLTVNDGGKESLLQPLDYI
jgi:hypothetical protein